MTGHNSSGSPYELYEELTGKEIGTNKEYYEAMIGVYLKQRLTQPVISDISEDDFYQLTKLIKSSHYFQPQYNYIRKTDKLKRLAYGVVSGYSKSEIRHFLSKVNGSTEKIILSH
jgi:hypothetical protein